MLSVRHTIISITHKINNEHIKAFIKIFKIKCKYNIIILMCYGAYIRIYIIYNIYSIHHIILIHQ